ncbi:DNA polymerase III subunit epsilon [Sphingopyxis yananensis]|jgi:DNA polymerase-3 subunit epsilon|uniref:DNA polymerase III subunit epsilon n=1 Tax=Sphingopyxis yananensis TaxID=2886687 RepID=UPI001D12280A|nr:DNA polymerase III subunit epsilon [Sphingopyxis yananensis]MCC2601383.1 DNA polymerase III subunit epsilon [Sphingopyxis yananensis]
MREIIFDTETTGFDPKSGDRMVEIGCVELVDRRETGNTLHIYFNPERDMPAQAEAVHGLSIQFLSDKPLFADKADEILAFVGDAQLVAHNARFDFSFLNAEMARAGRAGISMDRMICTQDMARKMHPGAKHTLDALCTRYGIDRSHRVKHGALLDAELLMHLYIEMTGGRQIGLGLTGNREVAQPSPSFVTGGDGASQRAYREPRAHAATPAELARHNEFVASLNQAIWLEGA